MERYKNQQLLRVSRSIFTLGILVACLLTFSNYTLNAQTEKASTVDNTLLSKLDWESIGPKRGGRSIAVAGSSARPFEYYFGATGGGLWKTTDGGTSWNPVTDGKINSSSVGAVSVSEKNPDIVYLGMGESQLRQNILQGDGLYKSTNGGKDWKHIGLKETQAISRIRIHPENPDVVYVAALGHPFGPNEERGIFKTIDGGETWEKILYQDDKTGAVDLTFDPNNPETIYATLWEVYRKPWILWSGGQGSGLYKSTDGGDTWQQLTKKPGLPKGIWGKSTVTVSGADSRRVYVNVEAEEGGLYRSDDGGESFTLMNNHRDLWQRAFYFLRIQADPVDKDVVYIMSFKLIKSDDGGKTFKYLPQSHADHHDLWIDPINNQRMINGNDGGGVVSVNGGMTWSHMRYPTAQIYRLEVTNDFPYHVGGGQQDNSTTVVPSDGGFLRNTRLARGEMMYPVGGGENGYVVQHPTKLNIFYSAATNALTRFDRNTGLTTDIQPFPRIVMGEPASVMPERWNWNYPIAVSTIDTNALYVGSQHLWRSLDEGQSWEKISQDLTRADISTMGNSGGPIIYDQDGPEIYATLYAIEPSSHDAGTIWVGSDDGLVHLTIDGGKSWQNRTPSDLLINSKVSSIECSPHDPSIAYITAWRYEMDDRSPYVWRTDDYGKTWVKIVNGLGGEDFGRSIFEDPVRQGLVYLGTERGVYVSFDAGNRWQSLSNNLPITPVMGIEEMQNDLVIATHGRSFWVMKNVGLLRQLQPEIVEQQAHLFSPSTAFRRSVPAAIDFFIKEDGSNVQLEILDENGHPVITLFDNKMLKEGMHRITWNLRYEGAVTFPNIILEGGNPRRGPWAAPGTYVAKLSMADTTLKKSFEVKKDPRLTEVSNDDLKAQFDLAMKIRNAEDQANQSVIIIRDLKVQLNTLLLKNKSKAVTEKAGEIIHLLSEVEKKLYQVKNQSPKDKIAFPIKLNDRLTGLRSRLEKGDGPPPKSYYKVYDDLFEELENYLNDLNLILQNDLSQLNKLLRKKILPKNE